MATSTRIFRGTARSFEDNSGAEFAVVGVTFDVSRVWKGPLTDTAATIELTGRSAIFTCSAGAFSFPGLSGPKWYFVQAQMSGPLYGMEPANATINPTALSMWPQGTT